MRAAILRVRFLIGFACGRPPPITIIPAPLHSSALTFFGSPVSESCFFTGGKQCSVAVSYLNFFIDSVDLISAGRSGQRYYGIHLETLIKRFSLSGRG